MTTTPDSRIRADFGLDPIDTSTTAGKVAVMQAAERIESTPLNPRDHAYGLWAPVSGWGLQDYRIAPPPARTALQRARTVAREVVASSAREGDVALCRLVTEIGSSELIYVHHNHPIYTESGQPVTPGRYRLVRDDA